MALTTTERSRLWRARNPERAAELGRIWRSKNREKCAERARLWRIKNKLRAAENLKRWRANNPEKVAAISKRSRSKPTTWWRRKENLEKRRAQAARYRAKHRKQYNASGRRKYASLKLRNPNKINEWSRRARLNARDKITPGYAKSVLGRHTQLHNHQIPDSLVQAYTAYLKLKRLCHNLKT